MKSGVPRRTQTLIRRVRPEHTVPHVLPGSLLAELGEPVLASATLLAMLEDACWRHIQPWITGHETRLGVEFQLRHTAPSLPGDQIEITTTCTHASAAGAVTWQVTATNLRTEQRIGELAHGLRIVDQHRFRERLGLDDATAKVAV